MLNCYLQTPVVWYLVDTGLLIALLVYLARFGARSSTISWFRFFLIFSIIYGASAAPLRCPPNDFVFGLLVDLYCLMGAVTIPALFIFVAHFTNKEHILNWLWIRLLLVVVPIVYVYLAWGNDLVVYHDLAHTVMTFGYRSMVLGPRSSAVGSIVLVGYLIPIIMCIRYYYHLDDQLKKREVRLVTWALILIIVPSTVIEGFVESVKHVNVFPIGPFTSMIACTLITYALTKYGLRVFSLNNITSDIMQVMPGGLIVLDHTNTVQYVNDGAATMLGRTAADLAGTSARHLFYNGRAYNRFQKDFASAIASHGRVAGQETQLATHSKRPLSVSVNVVEVYSGRQLTNRLVSFTDITPLKQAQTELEAEKAGIELKVIERTRELAASQATLNASIQSLPLGYIMLDIEYNIMAINPSALHILRTTNEALSPELLSEKLGGYNLRALVDDCMARRSTAEVKELAVDERFMHLFASPIIGENDTTLGAVMLMEDITEQKIAERSKDEFFSIASHELRTPLTSIRGNSSMMIDYYQQALKDPELQSMVHDVHESSIRLIGIVNDFLDVSRLEQGKVSFKFAEVNAANQIKGVAAELEHEAAAKHVVIKLDTAHLAALPPVIADADRLKQIVFNLLGNALKFTENGTITVTGKSSGGNVIISVTDSGRGIPPAAQKLLFHKFQQGGASLITRDTAKGTGLGLYISRLMAEGMDGRIWLETSAEGKGSTFAFTLPVATTARLDELAKRNLETSTTDAATGLTKTKPTA